VCTILDRLDLDPEELTVTVFGGFTGEFARALRDAGCEVIFIDPMAEWVDRAEAEGFEAYACSAEMIPTDVLTRTDAFATFECYYPLGGDPGEVLYTVLRMLSAPHGILFAETPTTREFRRENGAKRASLPQFKTLEEQLGTEYRYRETGDLRVYQYVQPERERSRIGRQAMILRHLYELGSNDEELIVDSRTVAQLVELTDLDTLEIEIYLDEILLLYRQLCGELAEFLPPGRLEVFDRQFRIQLL
jgi:hypothetical protein